MASIQAKEWLKAGYCDLRNIEYILDDSLLTHIVAFHSQQAVEKTLKAYLESSNRKIPKIHKLQTLLDLIELELDVDENILQLLDKLYIDSRYPGDMGLLPYGNPTLENARDFYEFAQNIFEQFCEILDVEISEIKNRTPRNS